MKNSLYDFVIVGGGPGGIGAAVEASILGVKNILLIEKGDNHSQTIRKFYKEDKRVDKDYKGHTVKLEGNIEFTDGNKLGTLNHFDEILDNQNISAIFNCEVESIEKIDGIFHVITAENTYLAKNIIIAIGIMGKPNKPSYKFPITLSQKLNFNLDRCSQDENILIVGGGNSAAEYAISLSD
ncbi:MAG: NAD(P)-binding domain-containing protein, partial [Campylobacteraceae bacterium]